MQWPTAPWWYTGAECYVPILVSSALAKLEKLFWNLERIVAQGHGVMRIVTTFLYLDGNRTGFAGFAGTSKAV